MTLRDPEVYRAGDVLRSVDCRDGGTCRFCGSRVRVSVARVRPPRNALVYMRIDRNLMPAAENVVVSCRICAERLWWCTAEMRTAYIRLHAGNCRELHEGDPVPVGIDAPQVATLLDAQLIGVAS